MLDKYFQKPVFWDYTITAILIIGVKVLYYTGKINPPKLEILLSLSSDIAGVSFTSAGFIITLVTVIITFKSNTKATKSYNTKSNSVFELFFASNLYFETVIHFKNCVKSLIFVSVVGFILQLLNRNSQQEILFIYCASGILIILLSLWRCLLILSKIVKMQE
ncbi:hypothetical protein [Marinifilum fragile]|uniref:hypothetical protein n=1 Tax=Marinifilum fragile TaxID=570161 RepID=UPI002AA7D9C5|nr:hypothetical protein [Marinifilum fragile]